MQPNNLVTVKYDELKHTTPTAFKLRFGGDEITTESTELWVPKAICDLDKEDMTVTVPEWYAVDKGLINQTPEITDEPPKAA